MYVKVLLGLCRGYIGVILGLFWGYIRVVEGRTVTMKLVITIMGFMNVVTLQAARCNGSRLAPHKPLATSAPRSREKMS